ncbi:hypothetical protein ACFPZ0_11600 [Streptomonospora nanhaiensis]|uniref:Uncharacterized protein n=1 Tax=Streptomonospora nanhaiensis TaxID=1323731 RepID=A0A853BPK9_9ACTN|nr:hypothetical protein [Streptomonospora nanhaiensis]MBV2366072.1 hypothetical protein [Streptomonospora nanhaiensis]MBX9388894.1 hypothetical protein [Streptomonospora nanhaiensis]NYI96547.1 hypothetical protein [Streptomonospora nanhaiensis]
MSTLAAMGLWGLALGSVGFMVASISAVFRGARAVVDSSRARADAIMERADRLQRDAHIESYGSGAKVLSAKKAGTLRRGMATLKAGWDEVLESLKRSESSYHSYEYQARREIDALMAEGVVEVRDGVHRVRPETLARGGEDAAFLDSVLLGRAELAREAREKGFGRPLEITPVTDADVESFNQRVHPDNLGVDETAIRETEKALAFQERPQEAVQRARERLVLEARQRTARMTESAVFQGLTGSRGTVMRRFDAARLRSERQTRQSRQGR